MEPGRMEIESYDKERRKFHADIFSLYVEARVYGTDIPYKW
jgi:hypothetical protein